MKVLWRNHLVKGATWEVEADMRSRYLIFSDLEVNFLLLSLSFLISPYFFYCLVVHSDYVMI